ncbi:hypothetical protein [Occultella aeris]|nr:hypothetical protein [Occultella aeris]
MNWQELAMEHGDTVLIVLGGIAAVLGTAWTATRDLALKRRLDGTDRFVTVAAYAQRVAGLMAMALRSRSRRSGC